VDSLDLMLLRGGEISTGIRLNGEKWGFSGGWEQWMDVSY